MEKGWVYFIRYFYMNVLKTAINKMQVFFGMLFLTGTLSVYGGISEDLSKALSEKDEAKKLKLYEKILAADPGQSSAYYNRGIIFLRQKAWQEARLDFKKYSELEPEDPLGFHNFAVCCYATGEYEKALSAWEEALALKAHEMDFIRGKVLSLIKLKRGEKVRAFLESYATTEPILWLKVELALSEKASEQEVQTLIQRILGINPDSEKALYEQAVYLLRNALFSEAKRPLACLVRLHGSKPDYLWMYAEVLFRLKEYEAALSCYEALKTNEVYKVRALVALKNSYQILGKNRELLNPYSDLLAVHPGQWEYCKGKLNLLLKEKREKEALGTLEAWHAQNFESFESLQYQIYLKQKSLSKEEHLALLRKALLLNPAHSESLEELIFLLIKDKKEGEAEAFLSAQIRKSPCFTHFYLRGLIYALLSRDEEALKDWGKALEMEKGNPRVLKDRAKVQIKLKKYREALNDLAESEKDFEEDAEYWLLRAKAEYPLQKEEEARVHYEKAKSLKRDLPDYEYYFSVFNQEGAGL